MPHLIIKRSLLILVARSDVKVSDIHLYTVLTSPRETVVSRKSRLCTRESLGEGRTARRGFYHVSVKVKASGVAGCRKILKTNGVFKDSGSSPIRSLCRTCGLKIISGLNQLNTQSFTGSINQSGHICRSPLIFLLTCLLLSQHSPTHKSHLNVLTCLPHLCT